MSPKYQLNQADGIRMLKVMSWSLASTVITVAIAFSQEVEVPPEYAFLLPVINTLLVGVQSFIRDNKNVERE
jgi:hypothetical protein